MVSVQGSSIYQRVFADAPDAILIVDTPGTIIEANHMITCLLGFTRTELVGQHVDAFVPSTSQGILTITHKDGRSLPCIASRSLILLNSVRVCSIILRDITHEQDAARSMQRLRITIAALEDQLDAHE